MSTRRIGLGGAVVTLVGYVVGASIFVLPADLMAGAGAGVVLSYLLAAVPAVFTCVAGAVIGNAFPVSGASYVGVRETISPAAAFLTAWLILCAAALGAALVAYGFADYVSAIWPAVPTRLCALGVVAAFIVLNLTPVTVTVWAQGAMVLALCLILAGFAVAGLARGDWSQAANLMPHGPGPVLTGAVAASFSYAGLQVIIDIGGEIRDPGRTIPRALALSFVCVLMLYIGFVLALVLLATPADSRSSTALVARIADREFGATVSRLIVLAALVAAATSINGILFTQSRDVRALAIDGRLPRALASERGGIPRAAVVALGALALLATSAGATIREYAVLAAMCMMAVQGILGIAALRVPARAARAWQQSEFRLSSGWLAFFGWGLVVLSALFFALAMAQRPASGVSFAAVVVVGGIVFRWHRAGADAVSAGRAAGGDHG